MEKAVHKVKITFTQQQMELLDKLKREGIYGEDYPDVILSVFHEYLEQEFGKGGVK